MDNDIPAFVAIKEEDVIASVLKELGDKSTQQSEHSAKFKEKWKQCWSRTTHSKQQKEFGMVGNISVFFFKETNAKMLKFFSGPENWRNTQLQT